MSFRDEAEQVGANVAELRDAAGMSQSALASAMRNAGQDHWRQNTVSRVETGKQPVRPAEAMALEAVLGGSVLTGTELAAKFQAATDEAERSIIAYRLQRIAEAQAEVTQMINEFRYLYDDDYRAEHPEVGDKMRESE